MNTLLSSLELINRKAAERICYIDSKDLSSKRNDFVKANCETWYVCTNTWLHMIKSVSQRTYVLALEYISQKGLIALIKNGDEVADAIMHSEGLDPMHDNHVWMYLLQDLADSVDCERKILGILRFAKRISPAKADLIDTSSIKSFLEVNAADWEFSYWKQFDSPGAYGRSSRIVRCQRKDRLHDPDYTLLKRFMPDIIAEFRRLMPPEWLSDDELVQQDALLDIARLGEFSNGSTAEQSKTLVNKLLDYSWQYVNWANCPLYPTSLQPHRISVGLFDGNWCRVTPVPKTYKAARIIAQEETARAFYMQGARKAWVAHVKGLWNEYYGAKQTQFIDVEDQSKNQEACRMASIDHRYVTVDSSHASDSIALWLGRKLLGEWFMTYVYEPYASHQLQVGTNSIRSNILFTSGSPLTFICESCFFLAVATVATKYTDVFLTREYSHKTGKYKRHSNAEKCLPPLAFGDDVLIDGRAYDLFLQLMTLLGITVNKSKTFGMDSTYRESCGVEYRNGYPLHTVKWPRHCFSTQPGKAKNEDLASLISLQHKVFDLSWDASRFLTVYVRTHVPSMTSSLPGTECDDLWEEIPRFEVDFAPYWSRHETDAPKIKAALKQANLDGHAAGKILLDGAPDYMKRELHSTLVSEYPGVKSRVPELEMFRYVKFLEEGPHYASALDKLLGVSQDVSRKAQLSRPSSKWQRVAR